MKQQVTVRVPATTSNLGPGFDCLGIALRLYNRVTVWRGGSGKPGPMLREAAEKFFARTEDRGFDFTCTISGEVPVARGLGSSVAVRLGLLYGLNELSGSGLSRHDLFSVCAALEGHPDNAAPGSFGGFTVSREDNVQCSKVSAQLHFVLLVPAFEVSTREARALLPQRVARTDAVMSAGNAAAIAAAFAARDYEALRGCFRDGLHQPFRKKLVPFLDDVITAAENAGALGAFLSGSGSTICGLTLTEPERVAEAMLTSSKLKSARTIITTADNRGARILKSAIGNRQSKFL